MYSEQYQAVTPEFVKTLEPNQIFVFGSNLAGCHGGGAAKYAYDHFGAEWGVGVGPTGQCYAIPTMQGDVDTIEPYVRQFITYAKNNPDKFFLVTRIGCGIAGFKDSAMASLFKDAVRVSNIALPLEFLDALGIRDTLSSPFLLFGDDDRFDDNIEDEDKQELKEVAFFEAVHAGCGEELAELAGIIINNHPKKVVNVFGSDDPEDVESQLLDFLEFDEYDDEVTGECHTFQEWSKIFYCGHEETTSLLYDKCKELIRENELLKFNAQ